MARGRNDDEGRINGAHWAGVEAQTYGEPLDSNPHPQGSDEWAAWRTGWLQCQEDDEWEESDEGQAAILLEEQPGWERREKIGANDLVKRVQFRADNLGRWLGMQYAPPVFVDDARRMLRESTEELLALKSEYEKRREDAA